MTAQPINPTAFVAAVKPLLVSRDAEGLCALIKENWTPRQITDLLSSSHDCDVRKVAALALGMVGGRRCVVELVKHLRDVDPMVNQMAEHALWSIWFRLGEPDAHKKLMCGLKALNARDLDCAHQLFSKAIQIDPKFAEAYNQRAIVHYLSERYEESIEDCKQTIELMPEHFGALAGMGHCYAHLHRRDEAIESYEKALLVNPHLDCVREAVGELKGGSV